MRQKIRHGGIKLEMNSKNTFMFPSIWEVYKICLNYPMSQRKGKTKENQKYFKLNFKKIA